MIKFAKRNKYLNYNLPSIGKAEIDEVVDTLKSGWLTTGPKTVQFENEFKKYVGSKHAVAISSCTAGLHLGLLAAGIKKGDEVITTPYTFVSTILSILEVGAKPIFVDIRKDTLNIDECQIESKISRCTRAILPVHFAGLPCEMNVISRLANKYDLFIIEDAAHAVGSVYRNKKVGNIGDVTSFSFYATKNLTTGEGGMVTTNDDRIAERVRILSLHGISKDSFKRYAKGGSWYYEVLEQGYKYNMMDIQAALGIHQLRKLDKMNERRAEIAQQYNRAFTNLDEIIANPLPENIRHSWHLYALQLNLIKLRINRNIFIEELKSRNIGTSVHFIPIFHHPYFQNVLRDKPEAFSVTEMVFNRVLSLPLYPSMTSADVKYVISAVVDIIRRYRK
jgi:dTDP-4-amino-4,6-dideoxygalactose transaminase